MIPWHNAITNPPKPLQNVLIAVRGEKCASEGFRLVGNSWLYVTGHLVGAGSVYAWSEMPACPEIPPTLKPLRKRSVIGGRP